MPSRASSMVLPALDHLILLVNDPKTASSRRDSALEDAIIVFSNLGFQVVRGGRHADNLTSNALIVFPDGIYIELIQFDASPPPESGESQGNYEQRRKGHWWFHSKPGWIDWCLADGLSDGMIQSINENAKRLRSTAATANSQSKADEQDQRTGQQADRAIAPRLLYQEPNEGGRMTPQGTSIKWKVTFPYPPASELAAGDGTGLPIGNARSHVPFWCQDLTPRTNRVPLDHSSHENHSPGIAEITLMYEKDTLQAYLDLSLSINQPIEPTKLRISEDLELVPNEIPHRLLSSPCQVDAKPRQGNIKVNIKVAEDPSDRKWIQDHGEGLYEVEIYVAADKLPTTAPPDGLEHTTFEAGYGRIRLSPILH